jgi:hypothetical protein
VSKTRDLISHAERVHKQPDSGAEPKAPIVTRNQRKPTEEFNSKKSSTVLVPLSAVNIHKPSTIIRPLAEVQFFSNENSTAKITKKLRKATVRSYHYHTKFLPKSQLKEIVTDAAVQFELFKPNNSVTKIWTKSKAPQHPKWNESYQKIFAILCLMKRTSKLKYFVEVGVCDAHLPLDKVSYKSGGYCGLRSRRNSHAPTVRIRRDEDVDEFSDMQWGVLAPFFNGSDGTYIPHSDLEDRTILPFLSMEAVKKGGSSKVFKVLIHPDHHSLTKSGVCTLFDL